jgi:hypothetical protein
MGFFGTIQSAFTLSKALRDQHESRKIHHRISEAKTAHMLKEYEIIP